jgi:serine/threonine protein kinase
MRKMPPHLMQPHHLILIRPNTHPQTPLVLWCKSSTLHAMQPNPKGLENTAEFQPYIGRTLGAYLLQSIVGVGGMGAVFVANHTRLDKRVAVKLLRTNLRDQKEAANRFFSEAKAAAAIGHENIIEVFDVGEDPGLGPFLAMELLDAAESLGSLIYQEGPLPLSRVAKIARQAANALFATHTAGIVHCDLKPSNILLIKALGQKDVVKIIDFGIARAAPSENQDPLVSSRMVLGTPKYMSPEQAVGRRPDGRSDQYALGLLVYTMLTGKPPFDGTPGEVMKRQYHEPPASLCAKRQDITTELEEVIFRALAKKPEERFQTIQLFGEALYESIDKIVRPKTTPRLPVSAKIPPSGPNPKVNLDDFKGMFDDAEGGNTGDHLKLEPRPNASSLDKYKEMFEAEGGATGALPHLSLSEQPNKVPAHSLDHYKKMFEAEGGHTGAVPPLQTTTEKPAAPSPQSLAQYKAAFDGESTGAAQPIPSTQPEKTKEEADIFSLINKPNTPPLPIPSAPIAYNLAPLPEEPTKENISNKQPSKPEEQRPSKETPAALYWSLGGVFLLALLGSYWSYLEGYLAPATLPQYNVTPREKKVVPSFAPSTSPFTIEHKKDKPKNVSNNKIPEPAPSTQETPQPPPPPEIKTPEQIETPNFDIPQKQ